MCSGLRDDFDATGSDCVGPHRSALVVVQPHLQLLCIVWDLASPWWFVFEQLLPAREENQRDAPRVTPDPRDQAGPLSRPP